MRNTIVRFCTQMRYAFLIALTVTAGSSVAFGWFAHAKNSPRHAPAELVINDTPLNREGNFTTSFAPVVKRVAPSVVKVYTTAKIKNTAMPRFRSPEDSMLRRFFGDQFGMPGFSDRIPMPQREGVGSGVIVTENGYLLTNNHVIEGADEVRVVMSPDNEEYTAEVIGRDPKSDIAVLKIDGTDFPHMEVANSDHIEVGDVVLAIGNPFGVGQTVTMGMVSATGRGHLGLDYEDFIQTDAAINPGNSGGALVDAEGRLIGINTAILSRTGGNHGIGFAIPVNLARNVMESLLENGHVVRGFLGVFIQDVNQGLADYFGLEDAVGAVVSDISPDSPAAEGGLREGDVIVEFNGKKVRNSRGLKVMVGQAAPGEEIEIEILRDGDTEQVWVTLDELPSEREFAGKRSYGGARDSDSLNGVTVTDIDSRSQQELNIPQEIKGALVRDVDPSSASWKAGLRPGDVIREINRNSVESAKEAVRLSETLDDDKVLLRVWRNGGSLYVVVDERDLK